MGNFCTRCGRPLQEGEVCTCQANTNPNANMQQKMTSQMPPIQPQTGGQIPPYGAQNQAQTGGQIPPYGTQNQAQMGGQIPPYGAQGQAQSHGTQINMEMANQVKRNFLQLLTKPVTVGTDVIEASDVKMAIIFFVLQGIASVIFAVAIGAKIGSLASMASGLFGEYGSLVKDVFAIPYARIIIATLLLSIVFSCVLALLLWVGHMLMKCPATYQKMLSAAAIRSAVMVPTILVSVLLFELNAYAGIFLFVIGNLWGFMAMTSAMVFLVPDERKDIFPLIISVVVLVFIVVVIFVMSQTWTLYLPDGVKEIAKAADDLLDFIGNFL